MMDNVSGDQPQILIDGFYCAYRSAFAFKELHTSDGRPTGLIYGFLRGLITIMDRWPGSDIVVCWDSPSTWRREAYEGYKQNRTTSKSVKDKDQLYGVAAFLRAVGVPQALATGHEADDVIGSSIDRSRLNIIYSRDRDFCQLVEDGTVQVYSPKSGNNLEVIFTEEVVIDKFGVSPSQLLMFRAMRGDSSDNLPGIRRFPSKQIVALIAKHDDICELLNRPDPSVRLTEYQQKALVEHRDQVLLNYDLMRIRTDIKVRKINGTFNRAAAIRVLDDFELKSLRSTIRLFEEQDEGLMGLFSS